MVILLEAGEEGTAINDEDLGLVSKLFVLTSAIVDGVTSDDFDFLPTTPSFFPFEDESVSCSTLLTFCRLLLLLLLLLLRVI